MAWPVCGMFAVPSRFFVTWNRVRKLDELPGASWRSESATTHPVLEGSVWVTATGVRASEPSAFFTAACRPTWNEDWAGHEVTPACPCGFWIHRMSEAM